MRYSFGKNWESFLDLFDNKRLEHAVKSIQKFFTIDEIKKSKILDIGCGSGLMSLAFANLGVKQITSVDYDTDCVKITNELLSRYAKNTNFNCFRCDVLSKQCLEMEKFDIVYSWGVLHHTGNMYQAIKNAASLVKTNGKLLISIYTKTRICWFWKIEKYLYNMLPKFMQKILIKLFYVLFGFALKIRSKQSIKEYKENYYKSRGMDIYHDIDDWLGGYPYESATPMEIIAFVEGLGFKTLKSPSKTHKMALGIFSTDCSEYLFYRGN